LQETETGANRFIETGPTQIIPAEPRIHAHRPGPATVAGGGNMTGQSDKQTDRQADYRFQFRHLYPRRPNNPLTSNRPPASSTRSNQNRQYTR
jgi:hypothetical protein